MESNGASRVAPQVKENGDALPMSPEGEKESEFDRFTWMGAVHRFEGEVTIAIDHGERHEAQ